MEVVIMPLNLEDMTISKIEDTIFWTDSGGKMYRQELFGENAFKLYRHEKCVAVVTMGENQSFVAHDPDYDPYYSPYT
jgi:hypothetical protein